MSTTGFLFVRGVGSSAPDTSYFAAAAALPEDAVAREVNWSWSDTVRWPFGAGKRDWRKVLDFLRVLGPAVLNSARSDLPPGRTRYSRGVVRILQATLLVAEATPGLLFLALAVTALGYWRAGVVLCAGAAASLMLPLIVAIVAFDGPVLRAGVRAAVLYASWPLLFLFLASSLAAFLPLFAGLVATPPLLAGVMSPGAWQTQTYMEQGKIFHESNSKFGVLAFLILWFGVVLAAWVVRWAIVFLQRTVDTPLKILADIMRYMGDGPYRASLQQQIADAVAELREEGCTRIVICAHSLGTVLTVDTLSRLTSDGLARIDLLTGGSPLRRFFHRFFPASYEEPAAICRLLQARFAGQGTAFDWLNVYRRSDPVGAALALPGPRDFDCDGGAHSLLTAHLDYWSDADIHALIRAHLDAPRDAVASPAVRLPEPAVCERSSVRLWSARTGLYIFLAMLALFPLLWGLRPVVRSHILAKQLEKRGVVTDGVAYVFYEKEYYEPSTDSGYLQEFDMQSIGLSFSIGKVRLRAWPNQRLVDLACLTSKAGGKTVDPFTGLPAQFANVRIRYLRDDPNVCTVVDCKPPPHDDLRRLLGIVIYGAAAWATLYLVGRFLWPRWIAPLVLAFTGVPYDPPEVLRWKPRTDWFIVSFVAIYPTIIAVLAYFELVLR